MGLNDKKYQGIFHLILIFLIPLLLLSIVLIQSLIITIILLLIALFTFLFIKKKL